MKMHQGGLGALAGIIAATVFSPVSTRAITIRDDVPDSSYVTLGASADYAAVGKFVNSWGYTGSGTLIAPDWVLTAGHNLTASGSGTFTLNGVAYASSQVIMNPGWNGDPFHGYDFGLVHLSSPVSSVAPVTLYPGSSELGQVGTYAGYGFTGTGLTGYNNVDGLKRACQDMINGDFGNPSLVYGSDFANPRTATGSGFGSSIPLPLQGCVAYGDSGGGVFIADGSQVYLAGVISFVATTQGNANSSYGNFSGFGRISAALPWISSTIPEPSAFTLLTATGLGLLCARRRRIKTLTGNDP
jgi:hypothetical protein